MNLEGKVAVVTGAGRGIGRATALELAALGAHVVVNDHGAGLDGTGRDPAVSQAVVREIEARGGTALANVNSVADWDGAGHLIEQALDRFGRIDILINNAGSLLPGAIWEVDPVMFKAVVADHIFGSFNCVRHAVPHMIKRKKGGRIVNFLSRGGLVGTNGNSAYGAGKGAIFGFQNSIARDLLPHNILVNAVNPAATRTRMVTSAVERAVRHGLDEAQAKRMLAVTQEPEEVSAVAAFLCADEITFTGQVFFAQAGVVSLLQPIEFPKKLYKSGRWTPAELVDAVRKLDIPALKDIY